MIEIIGFLFAEEQMFTTVTLILIIALLIGNILAGKDRKCEISEGNGAVELMNDEDLIILDVREKKERKAGYIDGDTHIPLANVKNKLDTLDKDKTVLVYCRSGSRSSHIAGLLTRNEFENVYNLKGGIQAWKRAKLPVKT